MNTTKLNHVIVEEVKLITNSMGTDRATGKAFFGKVISDDELAGKIVLCHTALAKRRVTSGLGTRMMLITVLRENIELVINEASHYSKVRETDYISKRAQHEGIPLLENDWC